MKLPDNCPHCDADYDSFHMLSCPNYEEISVKETEWTDEFLRSFTDQLDGVTNCICPIDILITSGCQCDGK